jgi:hypothetical protein
VHHFIGHVVASRVSLPKADPTSPKDGGTLRTVADAKLDVAKMPA